MTRGVLRTDGGSRGNPGPAASAYVLEDAAGTVVASGARHIGEATNNIAEYEAVILGLEVALAKGFTHIDVRCDSELVVRQLTGVYRVKHPNVKPLYGRATTLLTRFAVAHVEHVRREQNAAADALVNEALDRGGDVGEVTVTGPASAQGTLFPV